MPDIDIDFAMDFEDDRREEVIRYVQQKYGRDRVAQIITFGTMAARAAGRALGFAYGEVNHVGRYRLQVVRRQAERLAGARPGQDGRPVLALQPCSRQGPPLPVVLADGPLTSTRRGLPARMGDSRKVAMPETARAHRRSGVDRRLERGQRRLISSPATSAAVPAAKQPKGHSRRR
jgi:hypothetical protein